MPAPVILDDHPVLGELHYSGEHDWVSQVRQDRILMWRLCSLVWSSRGQGVPLLIAPLGQSLQLVCQCHQSWMPSPLEHALSALGRKPPGS